MPSHPYELVAWKLLSLWLSPLSLPSSSPPAAWAIALLTPPYRAGTQEQRITTIHTSPRGLDATFDHTCRTVGQKSPRNPRDPGQKAPSRRDLSIGTRHAARDRPEGRVAKIALGPARAARLTPFLTFQSWPLRAWSGMTGVVNSLKLPCFTQPACRLGSPWKLVT